MSLVNAGEVLKFAVGIEEKGMDFYHRCAQRFSDSSLKDTFEMLAGEEARHRDTFSGMLKNIPSPERITGYPDEYFAYLQAYADSLIFTAETEGELAGVTDALSAVEFGIRREADSILYYQEIKSFVPQGDQPLVERVLDEERKHFARLSDLRRNLHG